MFVSYCLWHMLFHPVLQPLRCAAYVTAITAKHLLIYDHTLRCWVGTTSLQTVKSIFLVENIKQGFTPPKQFLIATMHCCTNQQLAQRSGAVSDPVWVCSKWLLAFPKVPVTSALSSHISFFAASLKSVNCFLPSLATLLPVFSFFSFA